jgi:hypothetical protein
MVTSQHQIRLDDGGYYFVRTNSGLVTIVKYLAEHEMFFAVGDAIGYFMRDMAVIGKRISFDDAFDAQNTTGNQS